MDRAATLRDPRRRVDPGCRCLTSASIALVCLLGLAGADAGARSVARVAFASPERDEGGARFFRAAVVYYPGCAGALRAGERQE